MEFTQISVLESILGTFQKIKTKLNPPLKKLGQTMQIAELSGFLASSYASDYITGQTISIDGGMNI